MTSKEMEVRSGVPRANIRYYEAQGLLTPERAKNGYREYSEADLAVLEKIKLLRRLGVSVEELRELRQGTESLSTILDRRLAELGGEQASLERVRQVCGAVRSAGVSFDTLDAGRYLQDLDAPALPAQSGGEWWMRTTLPPLPATDTLPTVYSAGKRFFARWMDSFLLSMAILTALCIAGWNPTRAGSVVLFAIRLGTAVLLAVLEPLCLRLFAATPGKALMGLRLTGADGKKLSWSEGVSRYLEMLWSGRGFYIPVLEVIQMYRSFERCRREETQPWDRETIYTETTFRFRNAAAIALVLALSVGGVEVANATAQLPPNLGDLTVAEFAENFNRQAEYLGIDLGGELDSQGVWQEKPYTINKIRLSLGKEIPGADRFQYTVEDGHLTAVTLSGAVENFDERYGLPRDRMVVAVMAFLWARERAPLWPSQEEKQAEALSHQFWTYDWARDFCLRQGDAVATLEVEAENVTGYAAGYASPIDRVEENYFAFTFTMALEE